MCVIECLLWLLTYIYYLSYILFVIFVKCFVLMSV
jgi:hypothetical protein